MKKRLFPDFVCPCIETRACCQCSMLDWTPVDNTDCRLDRAEGAAECLAGDVVPRREGLVRFSAF